jgi:hypothetical protein
MNVYQARYRNALKKAAKINRYIKKGYHVFHDGALSKGGKFVMEGDELLWRSSPTFATLYYQNDKSWDHGYWTPMKAWNKNFNESFEVYKPEAKVAV